MTDDLPDWIPLPTGKVLLREDYQAQADLMGLSVPDMLALAKRECEEMIERHFNRKPGMNH